MTEEVAILGVPPNAVEATIRVIIKPSTGSVLIRTPSTGNDPIRLDGPISVVSLPLFGPKIFLELVEGAKEVKIETISYQF